MQCMQRRMRRRANLAFPRQILVDAHSFNQRRRQQVHKQQVTAIWDHDESRVVSGAFCVLVRLLESVL